jgi:hypothetical protein
MKSPKTATAILLASLAWLPAQERQPLPPPPAIKDLAWIEGHWICSIWNGTGEEVWLAPAAGTMLGMFRHHSGEQITIYELMEIQQEAAGPVMRIKHFRRGMSGLEAKDESLTLPLRNWNGQDARFETDDRSTEITYTKAATDRMEVLLRRTLDGKVEQHVFRFTRQR